MSHSSKLTKPKASVIGTSVVWGQWEVQVATRAWDDIWSWGQSSRTEPVTYGIRCCLEVGHVRIELNCTLAWKIPRMEEPGRLQSMGSLRVRHDWATSLSLFTFMHWRRKWQPTPVFLPGELQGRGRLMGCHLWGHTESDTTEVT